MPPSLPAVAIRAMVTPRTGVGNISAVIVWFVVKRTELKNLPISEKVTMTAV